MARIYYGSFQSIQNITYRVELWDGPSGTTPELITASYATRVTAAGGYQEGASCLSTNLEALSSAVELILSGNGFEIDRQGEGSTYYEDFTRPSRISTTWEIPTNTVKNAFIEIGNNQENKYAIVVYRGSDLFYVGRVIADQANYLRESVDGAMIFDLVAVDALNLIDGFNIDPAWFTDGEAIALDIIRKGLEYAGLDDYWANFGASIYLKDGVTMYDTAQASNKGLANTKLNILSFYNGFDAFGDITFIDTDGTGYAATTNIDLANCKQAINQILEIYGSRMHLESGAYWIVSDDNYNAASISTRNYNTSGTYQSTTTLAHAVLLGGTATRPKWEAKPTLTYQPPVRSVDVIEERDNAILIVRTEPDYNSIDLSIVDELIDAAKAIRCRMLIKWMDNSYVAITSGSVKRYQRYAFEYKIYFKNSGGAIKQYSGNLNDYFTPTGPVLYINEYMTIAGARNSWNTYIFDKQMPPPPAGYNRMFVDMKITAEQGSFIAPNSWTSSSFNIINFWGSIAVAQPFGTVENPNYSRITKNTISVAGAASDNSQRIEWKPKYYDGEGAYGYGSIYVYNGSAWVLSSDWYSGYASTVHDDLGTIQGRRIGGMYNKFVPVIQGTWHDGGTLTAVKTLQFDSTRWLFNGGTYNPRSETWAGEWLGLAPDYTQATSGGTGNYNPRTGERVVKDRLDYHEFAISSFNSQFSNVPQQVLEEIVNYADGAITAQPTLNTRYEVMLEYVDSSEVVRWHLQEHNASITYTNGTHTITNGYELIICNTTDGNVTVNLPNATESKGKKYYFIKTANAHVVTISGGTYNINGATSTTMNSLYQSKTIISNGVQWYIVSST
jgi:hypothetical protein